MDISLYTTFFITFWFSSMFCFVIDLFAPHYRVNQDTTPYEIIFVDYYKIVPLSTFNVISAYPYFYIVQNYYLNFAPNEFNPIINFMLWLFTTDLFFYTIHRAFHTKYLYHFHSIHHQFKYTYGMGAVYAHPVEFFMANLFPVSAPMVLYRMPLEFCNFIVFFATFYTIVVSHGGYKFKLGMGHLYHHLKYKYNFGLLKTDKLLGTSFQQE